VVAEAVKQEMITAPLQLKREEEGGILFNSKNV
jgi:hypothetical protein